MRITRLASAAAAVALAMTLASAPLSGQSAADKTSGVVAKQAATNVTKLLTLGNAKAVPMSSSQMQAVKGLHIHFTTPSQNTGHPHEGPQLPGWHQVNHHTHGGPPGSPSGPGYHGLCGAALNSPALAIPGQNTSTGVGGGCPF